ncbi:hypothetical protein BaRGS_00036793, partial [Batillaria attramentaria]
MPTVDISGAARPFFAAWCILALLLTSSYTCQLTSLLVSSPAPPPFTSLAEMVGRNDFRWGTTGGSKLLRILRASNDNVEQAVYRGLMKFAKDDPDVLSLDPNVQLRKVLGGHYAFLGEGATVEHWAAEHCDVIALPDRITGLESYNIFTPKFSTLAAKMNHILLRLQDTGVLSYLHNRWYPKLAGCHGNLTPSTSISLTTLQGPFYVAVGGLVMATVTLVVEMIWF